ncbi:MAG: pre-peptidase C-terminal domain-containing protein [Pirellulaceae bacterium]|nr:pre-peptidase C-terminal domain-containing protein [Pirellulaceae bacterium]
MRKKSSHGRALKNGILGRRRQRRLVVERLDRRDLLAGLPASDLSESADDYSIRAEGEGSLMGLSFRAENLNGQAIDPNNIPPNSIFNLVVQTQDLRTTPQGVFAIDEDIVSSNSGVVEVAMGELQLLRFPQAFNSGTFTLSINGQTSAAIVPPTSLTDPAQVKAAADRITAALTPILGNSNVQVVVSDDTGPAEFVIHFRGQYLMSDMPALVGNFSQTPGTTITDNYAAPAVVRSEVLQQHITYVSPYLRVKTAQFTGDGLGAFMVGAMTNEITPPANPGVKRSVVSIPMRAKSVGTATITGIPGTGIRENLLFGIAEVLPASAIESSPLNLRVAVGRTNLGTVQGLTERNGLSLVQGEDVDWFQFTTVATGNAVHEAAINFAHAQGDLELELYDASDRLLERSTTSNDLEVVSLRDRPAGTYFLKVTGFGGATNPAYSLRLNTPVVDIPADRFEVNNTRETATNLGAIEGTQDFAGLTIHTASDTDFYRFETKAVGKPGNVISTQFTHALGDLDLRLFNSAGNLLASSETAQDAETISLNGRPAGVYFVQVFGAPNTRNPNYALRVDAPELVIPSDRFEANDTQQTATSLSVPSGLASFGDLTVHQSGNNDWFKFTTAGASTTAHYVSIDFSHLSGDLDVELYNAQGTKLRESATIRDQERISLAGLVAGDYWLKVFGNSGATNPSYRLDVALPVQNIAADAFEANDSRLTATDLRQVQGVREVTHLSIHASGNDDWFRFETVATSTSSHFIGLVLNGAQGDIDLEFLDASGNVLASSATTNNWEIINLAGRPAGVYYARVSGYRGGLNPNYSFSIFAPQTSIRSDAYERNDSIAAATDLRTLEGVRTIEALSIHAAGDFDWFAFSTTSMGTSADFASIQFSNSLGDLDLTLWDAAGNRLSQSESSADEERISLAGFSAGRYFLRIAGHTGVTVNPDYRLTIDAPSQSIPSDAYEPNNTLPTAFDLRIVEGDASVSNATIHEAGNSDFYRFEIRATGQSTHFVEAQFNHSQGDLDLTLFNSLGVEIASSNTSANTERISLQGLSAGVYYVKVAGFSGAVSAGYRLNIAAPIFGDLTPDRKEANDALVNASQLRNLGDAVAGDLKVEDLTIHSATDVDFFSFTTVAEGTLANSVSILFDGGNSDLNLELLSSAGAIIRSSSSLTGTEFITLDGLAAGTYIVKVHGVNGARGHYQLAIDAPAQNRLDAWTIMVYMTSSDLEQFAFSDINELEQAVARLPGSVNVAILWDQSAARTFYSTHNDAQPAWSGVGRGLIRPDQNDSKIASSFELLGELNTGNAVTLTSFIDWAATEAPAEQYALVSWDHGAGIFGSNFDNSDNLANDNLRINEFVTAIGASIVPRFDVLAFDACLMSMVEVGYNLRTVAGLLVGSQEVVGSNGYNYLTAFSNLFESPELVDGDQLASNIVNSYVQEYAGSASGWDTQSAVRTSGLEALAAAIRTLTDLSATLNATQLSQLATIIEASTSYNNPDFRDLGSIMAGIADEATLPTALRNAAQGVVQAIAGAVIALANDARRSSGVSIFVPEGTSLGSFYASEFSAFISASGWDGLVARTGGQSSGGGSGGRFGRSVSVQDWAENNDLPAFAENLFRLGGSNIAFNDLSLHDAKDVDWYRFSIGATGQATDKIGAVSAGNSLLRSELYDRSGTTLLRSAGSDGNVSLTGLTAGEYLLKVSSPVSAVVRRYSVVASAPAAAQANARFGDISLRDKALPLGVVANQLTLASIEIAPGAENWFAIDTPRLADKRWFSVQVNQAGGGSLKATILDSAGKPISSDQGSDTLVLGYQASGASERYFLRVKNEQTTVNSFNVQVSNLVETFSDVLVQERLSGALVDQLPLSEVVSSVGNVTIQDNRFEWVSGGLRIRDGIHFSTTEQTSVFVPLVVTNALNANDRVEFVLPVKILENARPYFNQANPENVNNDFDRNGAPVISPLDALIIINFLNRRTQLDLNVRNAGIGAPANFVDVSGDGVLSPRDALLVINKINRLRAGGEGESSISHGEGPAVSRSELNRQAVDQLLASWNVDEFDRLQKRRIRN